MSKITSLFSVLLFLVFSEFYSQTGIIDFNTTDDTNLGSTADDGEGGSLDISGVTFNIFIGNGSGIPSGGDIFFDQSGAGYEGLSATGNPGSTGFLEMILKTNDGSEFDFNGFSGSEYGFVGAVLKIEGFRDGASQGSTEVTLGAFASSVSYTAFPDTVFGNVDEVRITESSGANIFGTFDRFVVGEAVVPNTPPTFTALASNVESTDEDTAVEITFAEIAAQGNEMDSEGTVDAFVVKSVSSGSLMINGSAFAAGTNDEITAAQSASWTPAMNASGTLNVFTITAQDDDGAESVSPVQATVSVTSVNDEPSFTKGADETVNEDSGAQTVNGWATSISDGDGGTQTLTFTVVNNNNGLFSAQPAISTSGNLTYTPASGASGVAIVSVVLMDNGGTANGGDDTFTTQQFTITVNSVNDEPSFTKGADETVNEDAGAQTVNGWATSINDGDGATQVLSFNVTNDENTLFSVQPDINETTGDLTYTPAPNAFGSATVTVSLSDDGGTANGGDDTSVDQTFTITVNQVNDTPVVISSFSSDTGVSAADYITSDNTPDIAGTAEPNSSITLFLDGMQIFSGTTIATNMMGNWSFTYPNGALALLDGIGNLIVRSTLNGVDVDSSAQQIMVDTVSPTVVVSTTSTDPTDDNPIPVTITFNQEVTGFVASDISVTNGSVIDFATADNTVFTFNIDPTSSGNITVNVAANVANDVAGNGNTVASEFEIEYDVDGPIPTITSSEMSPTDSNTVPITITFDEEVQNFTASDLTITNGSISSINTTDNITFTGTILPETGGTITANIAANVAEDTLGNGNSAATEFSIVVNGDSVSITTPIAGDNIVDDTESQSLTIEGTSVGVNNASGFTLEIGTVSESVTIKNDGTWEATVDISGLNNGNYTVSFSGPDSFGFTISDAISITLDQQTLSIGAISIDAESIEVVNPVKDTLIITGDIEVLAIKIYDLSGALVTETTEVSNLASGVYIAVIETSAGVITKKIVKE